MPSPLTLLRKAVKDSGLTAQQFTRSVLKRPDATVNRWLRGEVRMPDDVVKWLKQRVLPIAFALLIGSSLQAQGFIYLDTASLVTRGGTPTVIEYQPPAVYREWMAEIAKCEGLDTTSIKPLRFFVVDAQTFKTDESDWDMSVTLSGYSSDQIYVGLPHIGRKDVITHELLHYLLHLKGIKSDHHPAEYFGKCGMSPALPIIGEVTAFPLASVSR